MTKAISSFSANRSAGATRYRHVLCAIFGHSRSRVEARELAGAWFTVCQRCACRLRRDISGRWREISQDEFFDVVKHVEATWRPSLFESGAFKAQSSTTRPAEVPSGRRSPGENPGYDARYFARKHGITLRQARDIIASGGDRNALNAAAEKLKSKA